MCPRMLLDPIRGTARAFGTREQGDGRKWVLSRLLKAYEESATITPVVGPDRSGLRLYSCSLVLCEGGEWGRGCESTVGASGSGRMPTEKKKAGPCAWVPRRNVVPRHLHRVCGHSGSQIHTRHQRFDTSKVATARHPQASSRESFSSSSG